MKIAAGAVLCSQKAGKATQHTTYIFSELPPSTMSTTTAPADAAAGEAPDAKKQKMEYPMAPDEEWPEAWLMPDTVEDQCKETRMEPNVPVTADDLKKMGIAYWKMDAESFEYPVKSVPWDPKDAMDPKLKALRDARGYSYADIITVHPDHLPDFEKVRSVCTALLEWTN
jgi:hypothetical protein